MYDLDRFPKFVANGKPPPGFFASIVTAVTDGTSSLERMRVETVEKANHTPEGLIEFLYLRTNTTRKAYERSKTRWGRLYNNMTGSHPIYVPISGRHLIQIFVLLGEQETAKAIPPNAECGIRLDISESYAERLLRAYRERAG